VLADLKQNVVTRDIPVIMCTIASDPQRAYAMGAADYLHKPILETDLLQALDKVRANGQALPHSSVTAKVR
jgi:CheY-like chemotaxis protein